MRKIILILLFLSIAFAQFGNRVGRWKGQPEDPFIKSIEVYRNDDIYFVLLSFEEGKFSPQKCYAVYTERGIKLIPMKENIIKEWWLLTYKGTLESWDEYGLDWKYVPY